MRWKQGLCALPAMLAMACQSPVQPSRSAAEVVGSSEVVTAGAPPATIGGGHYLFSNTADVAFNFNAVRQGHGGTTGHLYQSFVFEGLLIEFRGRVTCFSVDAATGRAWIGGVVTENNSTHPQFTTARTQPGRDIWFRVLDSGEGSNAAPDRSTIPGFEGDRGIITSAEYCAAKLWLDGDANTHPVTEGNIQVRPQD